MDDFAGLWRLGGRSIDADDLARLSQAVAGPGAEPVTLWQDRAHGFAFASRSARAADGHACALTNLENGHVLVASSHLSERDATVAMLRHRPLADASDSMIIGRMIEQYGSQAAIERLRGAFAVAVWEPSAYRLVLACDEWGSQTLYHHRNSRFFAFSTRLAGLLAIPEVSDDLDERMIAEMLILCHDQPARTIYAAVDRLPSGHAAIVTSQATRLITHQCDRPAPGSLRRGSDADYIAEAWNVLDLAVADAFRASGPVALSLTGGLDSTAIAVSATRQGLMEPVLALTRIPDGPVPSRDPRSRFYYSEESRVKALADRLPGLDWHAVLDDGVDWGERVAEDRFAITGIPTTQPVNLPWFFPLYRNLAARGAGAAMVDGSYGNSYFSDHGNDRLRELAANWNFGALYRESRALARQGHGSSSAVFGRNLLRSLIPGRIRRWRKGVSSRLWWQRWPLNPEFAEEIRLDQTMDRTRYATQIGILDAPVPTRRDWESRIGAGQDMHAALQSWTGVEMRHPLSDRRVTDYFGALPLDQHLRDGIHRSLARRMLHGIVPDEIATSRLRGNQNGDWFARLSRDRPNLLSDMDRLRTSPLARRIVDLPRVQRLLDQWPADADTAEVNRRQYAHTMINGVEMARFLIWHEQGGLRATNNATSPSRIGAGN